MGKVSTQEYEDFIVNNRIKVNKYLNVVLWFFVLTGPAIALGVKAGFFHDITYTTCLMISAVMAIVSGVHFIMLKKIPRSAFTGIFALTVLNFLLVYMSYSHISIRITWFLVPLLSLLLCDKYIYFSSVILNFILMTITTWISAPYFVSLRADYDKPIQYFVDVMGGYTSETPIMFASGFILGKLALEHFRELFNQKKVILEQEKEMKEKMEILDSMVEIYDNVNLINFVDSTETSLRSENQEKTGIDMSTQTHTLMSQKIQNQVVPDQLEAFKTFTNIKTIRARLSQKKIISGDFMDVVSGWFRAQYITVDSTLDGIPNVVIYVTRNVDEEKRREEHLIRISMTDEMTRLFNRRCYEEDLAGLRKEGLPEDFVLFSVDVNGLKTVNDTLGHAAGDELIKGAADVLSLAVGNRGKAYRTGGDEFMAVVHMDDPESLRNLIHEKTKDWHGVYCEKISVSVGYAALKDNTRASIDDLERKADADMYAEKARYYKESGIDRRRQLFEKGIGQVK